MIDLKPEHYQEVKRIFDAYLPGADVRVFGSRIKGTSKRYSDLDLVVFGEDKKDAAILSALKSRLSESDLPFTVDVLDWAELTPQFRAVIKERNESL
jgi:predicted nucleotidyltransferase